MKTNFEKFKEVFENTFKDIYVFMEKGEWEYENITSCPFKYKLQENLDKVEYDSYGNEDSDLKRIYFIEDFNIYIEFYGNRSSYQGEEWYRFKEVFKREKTISVWESVN